MSGGMIAFTIWTLCGLFFLGEGVFCFFARRPVGFWANVKTAEIEDVSSYNRAVGKLWIIFGTLFIILGFPLLTGQNSPWVILSILGIMVWCIMLMVVYIGIEQKYRKKK